MKKKDAVFWPICLNLLYSFPKWSWDKHLFIDPAEEKSHYLTPRAWRIYSILNAIDLGKPVGNRSFLRNVQHMHKYQFSLNYLNTYGMASKVYAEEMVRRKLLSPEIESTIIQAGYKNLMYDINYAGHKWSAKAKKLIKKLHPRAYQHFFQK